MAVILRRAKQYQKFYVHEVISEKKEDIPFKTRNGINITVNPSGNLPIISLLQKIEDVKHNSKKSLSETDSDVAKYFFDKLRHCVCSASDIAKI